MADTYRLKLDLDAIRRNMLTSSGQRPDEAEAYDWLLSIGCTPDGDEWIADEQALRSLSPVEITSKSPVLGGK